MESLRLELNEDLARELEKAPLHIRARIDERQKGLLELVRQFYNQKYRELQVFARDQLLETDEDTISELDQSASEPKLKSIVKRRPSSSDKRVSFINSPVHAPISTPGSPSTDATDEGEDDAAGSPDSRADAFSSVSTHMSNDAPFGVTFEDNVRPRSQGGVAMSMPALDLSALTKHPSSHRPRLLDDGTAYTNSPDPEPRPMEPDDQLDHEDLFSFQSELNGKPASERPATAADERDEMAQMHHAPLLAPSPPRRQLEVPGQRPKRPSTGQGPQFNVGSAPISIQSSPHGLDGDGGPMPLSAEERAEEASLSRPDDLASLPRSKINELDPSTMSFSQRMEWESLRRRDGS